MSRQVIDGIIIAAVLALGATHLYAQGMGGRKVIHPNRGTAVVSAPGHGVQGRNGGAAVSGPRPSGRGQHPNGGQRMCMSPAGQVPCEK
jgi:hypothetical protein